MRKLAARHPAITTLSTLLVAMILLGLPAFLLMWQGRELDRVRANNQLVEAELREEQATKAADVERARAAGAAEERAEAEYAMLLNGVQRDVEARDFGNAAARMLQYENQVSDEASDFRDWEWHYLKQLLDQSSVTLPADESVISALRLSPDESQFVTVGLRYVGDQVTGVVRLRDAATGELLKTIADSDEIFSDAAFSPDGSTLATVSVHHAESELTGWVRLWDVASGENIQSRQLADDYSVPVKRMKPTLPQIEFDPTGKLLVTSAPIVAFDAKTLEPQWKVDGWRLFLMVWFTLHLV